MNTITRNPEQLPARESSSRRNAPAPGSVAPAVYIGTLNGFRHLPAIDLYNLLAPLGHHPIGSTVSGRTLERHGYHVPVPGKRDSLAISARRRVAPTSSPELVAC